MNESVLGPKHNQADAAATSPTVVAMGVSGDSTTWFTPSFTTLAAAVELVSGFAGAAGAASSLAFFRFFNKPVQYS